MILTDFEKRYFAIKELYTETHYQLEDKAFDINDKEIILNENDIKNKISEMEADKNLEKKNKENKKASGKQKLKDLGLDDDEIKALLGV
jgi:hypothetical protein